jgi:hypothetical protein
MASPSYQWENTPLLQLWTEKSDGESGKSSVLLESYDPSKSLPLMMKALSNNAVSFFISFYFCLISLLNEKWLLYMHMHNFCGLCCCAKLI